MSNITNLNRDYLIKINVKEATIDVPKMTFWNTDKKTSNMFVQLVINMSENELIKNYATIENATDYKIVLNVIKPKTNQYRTFEAKLLNEEKALFEIDLTSEFIDQVGNYNFEFEVSSKVENNDESITTSSSTYEVKGSILTNLNQEISSSPDLPILKQLIEQVKSLQGGDLTGYQKKSDNSLETTSKEVVGAINEVNSQFKEIAKEIENVGQPTDAQITNAVNSYLENNPITFDDLWSDIEDGEQFEITPLPIITGINAVYTQGERKIYSDTVLTTLKTDLVVKANYDDGTSTIINDYTLEGSLEVGTSVISVIYKDFVTTFNVTVTEKVIVSRVTRGLIKELNDITEQTLTNDFNYLDLNTGSFTMMAKCTRLNGASNYATSFGSNNYPIMCQISWQNILMLNYHRISGNEGYIANQVELDKTLYDEENEAIIITFVHDGNGNIDMYCNDTIVKSIKMDITATYEKLTSITIGGSENKKKITWLYYNVELTKDEIKQNINNLI